jgi:hypothetical protein
MPQGIFSRRPRSDVLSGTPIDLPYYSGTVLAGPICLASRGRKQASLPFTIAGYAGNPTCQARSERPNPPYERPGRCLALPG